MLVQSTVPTYPFHEIGRVLETPQDIMEEYNGCSVPQYTAYPRVRNLLMGVQRVATSFSGRHGIGINPHSQALTLQF